MFGDEEDVWKLQRKPFHNAGWQWYDVTQSDIGIDVDQANSPPLLGPPDFFDQQIRGIRQIVLMGTVRCELKRLRPDAHANAQTRPPKPEKVFVGYVTHLRRKNVE